MVEEEKVGNDGAHREDRWRGAIVPVMHSERRWIYYW